MLDDLVRNSMDVNEHERLFNFTNMDIYVRNCAFVVVYIIYRAFPLK